MIAILAGVTPIGWGAIALAVIALLSGAVKAAVEIRKLVAPVEMVHAKAAASREREDSKRFTHQAALAERLLEEREEEIEAVRIAHEKTRHERDQAERQASMYLVQSEGLLASLDAAEKDAAEHRSCRELVRSQDGKISAQAIEIAIQAGEIRVLTTKVDACEERHEYADKMIEWLTSQVGPRASEPPPTRPRSITPVSGTPAITKE